MGKAFHDLFAGTGRGRRGLCVAGGGLALLWLFLHRCSRLVFVLVVCVVAKLGLPLEECEYLLLLLLY